MAITPERPPRLRPRGKIICLALPALALLVIAACRARTSPAAEETAPLSASAQEAEGADAPATAQVISQARNSLKTGDVEDAAARLAQLQVRGATFNAQQAREYRQTLSEAYDRAIEAAQRGDPKAQAALQLLRAAAPR